MEENLMNANLGETTKIKTHFAKIIIGGTAEKPYYSIMYFDPTDREYHIGFSSYFLEYVYKWLSEEFEIVDRTATPMTNADRIRAMSDEELAQLIYNADGVGWCSSRPECADLLEAPDGIPEEKCLGCLTAWLQQPAEVSGDA